MGLKKKRPGIATAKPSKEPVKRASPTPKTCCGALRGHKPDCTGSAAEDLFDGGPTPVETPDVPQAVEEAAFAANAVTAALRGIEEAVVRLADSVDSIKVIIGSRANEERMKEAAPVQAEKPAYTAPKIRKLKVNEPAPVAAEPVAVEPEPAPAPPPEKKPAPAVKAVAVSLEQVRSEFLAFASKKGRDEAVAILGRFGAPKVGDLPVEQYPAFLSALKGA